MKDGDRIIVEAFEVNRTLKQIELALNRIDLYELERRIQCKLERIDVKLDFIEAKLLEMSVQPQKLTVGHE
jgi:hypothetical protein